VEVNHRLNVGGDGTICNRLKDVYAGTELPRSHQLNTTYAGGYNGGGVDYLNRFVDGCPGKDWGCIRCHVIT
ncbi:MAG: hypothetical protein LPH21_12970, partial [Shewanella sp.]|nr:hypothetical protein [Shewanella sp.]